MQGASSAHWMKFLSLRGAFADLSARKKRIKFESMSRGASDLGQDK